jgi:hypothetical protein
MWSYVGQRITESSIRDFLQGGIEDLPREKQLAIFPALDAASHTVASSDASVLGAVGETRLELRQELDTKIEGVETRSVELLDTRVGDPNRNWIRRWTPSSWIIYESN